MKKKKVETRVKILHSTFDLGSGNIFVGSEVKSYSKTIVVKQAVNRRLTYLAWNQSREEWLARH